MSFLSKLRKSKQQKIPFCSVVIAAAGSSSRMNGEDKLFIDLCGMPVLAHALREFENCGYIEEIVIVGREDRISDISEICSKYGIAKAAKVMFGGATRQLSVFGGVFAVSPKAELIAVHDGARPCIDRATIERTIEAAAKHHAAAPAVPVTSTIKKVKNGIILETVDRSDLYEVQTPQVFAADLIKAALTNAENKSLSITDECKAVELIGAAVRITEGSHKNIKLTTHEDIAIAEAILGELF